MSFRSQDSCGGMNPCNVTSQRPPYIYKPVRDLCNTPWARQDCYHCPQCIDAETEAQKPTGPQSHSQLVVIFYSLLILRTSPFYRAGKWHPPGANRESELKSVPAAHLARLQALGPHSWEHPLVHLSPCSLYYRTASHTASPRGFWISVGSDWGEGRRRGLRRVKEFKQWNRVVRRSDWITWAAAGASRTARWKSLFSTGPS